MTDDRTGANNNTGNMPKAGQPTIVGDAQAVADSRLRDLASVLGNATRMTNSEEERAAFVERLRNTIQCPAPPPEQDIDELIDSFGRLTGRVLSGDQRALLSQGIHALAQINASDQSRHDLWLVRNNIEIFISSIAQVLGVAYRADEHRLLVRALVRLVGDGPHQSGPADPA